nr:MAG TPA: hypothetical protein [Caudoviricetes sp.]
MFYNFQIYLNKINSINLLKTIQHTLSLYSFK